MITSFVIKGFSAGGWEIVFNFVEHPRNNFGREVDAESDRRKYTFRVPLHDIRYGNACALLCVPTVSSGGATGFETRVVDINVRVNNADVNSMEPPNLMIILLPCSR